MKVATVDDGQVEEGIFSRVFADASDWRHFSDFDQAEAAIRGGDFDNAELIVLDMQLDQDDEAGWRLTAALETRALAGSIVVLSVSEVQEMICKCFRSGASAYIVKPPDDRELEDVVRNLKIVGPMTRSCSQRDRWVT